jgi:pimeloyl-ACP methyl ester carboxylesterase
MSDLEHERLDRSQGLHVVRQGSGKPAIMLHGYGTTQFTWRNLVPVLAAQRELWLVDLKGHGGSACPLDGKYALQDQVELIYRLIVENDLRQLTLIGHSMGGGVALLVALKLVADGENRLSSLVLIDGIAFPQRLPLFIRLAAWPLLGPMVLACVPVKLLVRLVLMTAFFDRRKIERQAIDAYAVNLRSHEYRQALIDTAKRLVHEDLKHEIRQYSSITVPTLIIWGQQDRVVPPSVGARLNTVLANSRYLAVENCGHMPQEERPQAILEPITKFLGY